MADGGRPILALYRRYRPDSFDQIVGQDHVVTPLTAAIAKGRINHAYLFSGPRGCGKTTSARVLARSLNCVEGPTPTPCGVCPSCVDLANGGSGSLDVIEIDAASHRGIDDARDLRDRVTFAPVRDPYKVVIIDEAHQITSEGFNALLKVVEEPPEHVVFVFATTEPEKVLGTIRSRTHHFPFRLVPPARLIEHLEDVCRREGVTVDPAALSLVVRAGGGSVRDSMSVLDQLMAGASADGLDLALATSLLGYVPESLLDDMVDALAAVDGAAAFAAVHRAVEAGHDPRRYTNDLLERLRTLVVVSRVGADAAAVLPEVPDDAFERLRTQASHFGHAELSRAADVVAAALGEMAGATSPRLLLELLVARLLVVGADTDAAVSTRVERLERQLHTLGEGGAIGPAQPVAPVAAPGPSVAHPAPPATSAPAPARASAASAPAAAQPAREGERPVDRRPAGEEPSDRSPSGTPPVSEPAPAARPEAGKPPAAHPSPAQPAATARPATAQPATAQPATAEPAASQPATAQPASGVTVEVVRRTWDQVVDRLRTIRRLTWTLVSENAQVLALDGTALTLGFPTQGLADAFNQRGHSDCVKEALVEVLGVDRRVVGVTGGRAAEPEPREQAPAAPVPPQPAADGWPEVAGPSSALRTPSAPASEPRNKDASDRQKPGRSAARDDDRQVGQDRPKDRPQDRPKGRPRIEPVAPEPVDEDAMSRDDPSADVEGESHGTEMLARLLGAQVIEDQSTGN